MRVALYTKKKKEIIFSFSRILYTHHLYIKLKLKLKIFYFYSLWSMMSKRPGFFLFCFWKQDYSQFMLLHCGCVFWLMSAIFNTNLCIRTSNASANVWRRFLSKAYFYICTFCGLWRLHSGVSNSLIKWMNEMKISIDI